MKKTLIITLEYPPQIGGIATYVNNLASALDLEKVIILTTKNNQATDWDKEQKYKIIRKNLLFPKFIWPRWLRMCWHIRKIVKKEKIELIMIHHVLPVGYAGVINKKFRRIPFLLFSHGTDLVAGTKSKWKKRMVRMVSHHAQQIIFNSENLKHRYLQALPEFENKSTVLYPCPTQGLLTPAETKEVEDLRIKLALQGKKVILSVSRLVDGKGFPHLIRALPKILERAPHLVWLIVGDGPKKNLILQEIQKRNLQNIVRFIGEIPFGELKKYYYLADLFVLLTHPDEGREEGLGLVFLEAAAAGLPVVAGRSGGVEEAVINGQTGLVLDIHTEADKIVDSVAELLNNKEYADKLGQQAQDRIMSDFKWEEQIKLLNMWVG